MPQKTIFSIRDERFGVMQATKIRITKFKRSSI
jgi:hypothetical protein